MSWNWHHVSLWEGVIVKSGSVECLIDDWTEAADGNPRTALCNSNSVQLESPLNRFSCSTLFEDCQVNFVFFSSLIEFPSTTLTAIPGVWPFPSPTSLGLKAERSLSAINCSWALNQMNVSSLFCIEKRSFVNFYSQQNSECEIGKYTWLHRVIAFVSCGEKWASDAIITASLTLDRCSWVRAFEVLKVIVQQNRRARAYFALIYDLVCARLPPQKAAKSFRSRRKKQSKHRMTNGPEIC